MELSERSGEVLVEKPWYTCYETEFHNKFPNLRCKSSCSVNKYKSNSYAETCSNVFSVSNKFELFTSVLHLKSKTRFNPCLALWGAIHIFSRRCLEEGEFVFFTVFVKTSLDSRQKSTHFNEDRSQTQASWSFFFSPRSWRGSRPARLCETSLLSIF